MAETLIKSAFERLFCYFVQFLCSHVFHVLIPLLKMAETLINSSFFDKGIFHVLYDALHHTHCRNYNVRIEHLKYTISFTSLQGKSV